MNLYIYENGKEVGITGSREALKNLGRLLIEKSVMSTTTPVPIAMTDTNKPIIIMLNEEILNQVEFEESIKVNSTECWNVKDRKSDNEFMIRSTRTPTDGIVFLGSSQDSSSTFLSKIIKTIYDNMPPKKVLLEKYGLMFGKEDDPELLEWHKRNR